MRYVWASHGQQMASCSGSKIAIDPPSLIIISRSSAC